MEFQLSYISDKNEKVIEDAIKKFVSKLKISFSNINYI